MKKSLLVTLEFPPQIGGIANYYSGVCSNLDNNKIIVLTSKIENSQIFDKELNYKIYRRNLISQLPIWPKWIFDFYYVFQIIRREKIEYLQVGQVLPIGIVALFFKNILGIPYLVYIHGMDLLSASSFPRKKMLLKKILRNADKIITVSQFNIEKISEFGIEEQKIVLVQPALNLFEQNTNQANDNLVSLLKKRYNLGGKKILLSLGRLVKRKGFDKVISAIPVICQKFPNLIYVIAGRGEAEKYLKEQVSQLILKNKNLINNFLFVGEVTEEEKIAWYKLCDIFIMPSRQINNFDVEGFGIVYLEANYFGKPVIAGCSGGVADAVLDNQTGLLVDPESIDQIGEAVVRLLSDTDMANRLGEQGRNRVINEFNWVKQARKIEGILD